MKNIEDVSEELARLIPESSKEQIELFVANQAAKAVYYQMLLALLSRVEDNRDPQIILTEARFLVRLIKLNNKSKTEFTTKSSTQL